MTDHKDKDTNPNSPFATQLMQGQSTEHKSGPALIEKFVVRLPKGLRKKIKHLSEQNRRSMNSEIIMVLEQHIQQHLSDSGQDLTDDLAAAMATSTRALARTFQERSWAAFRHASSPLVSLSRPS